MGVDQDPSCPEDYTMNSSPNEDMPWKPLYSKNHGESIEQEVDITSKSNNIHVTHLPTPKEWLKWKEDATILYHTPKRDTNLSKTTLNSSPSEDSYNDSKHQE